MSTVDQPLSTRWDLLTKEASVFAANHSAAAQAVAPPLLDAYSRQLCEQLHSMGESWWFCRHALIPAVSSGPRMNIAIQVTGASPRPASADAARGSPMALQSYRTSKQHQLPSRLGQLDQFPPPEIPMPPDPT